ncbi:MAG: hypothetical protein EBZ48_03320 [Proteobacteria bacterium]|nr:hypothetical protein [Pseudomonadota bacterium]
MHSLDKILAALPQSDPATTELFGLQLPALAPGEVGAADVEARLDAFKVRLNALVHNKEAAERELNTLREIIRRHARGPGPDQNPQ